MSIVSNYIWEKGTDGGRNPVSLLVQQVKQQTGLRSREISLFCVCESSEEELGGHMTEHLVDWFHKSCLPACGGRQPSVLRGLLEREVHGLLRELTGGGDAQRDRIHYGGLLLTGNSFYLFGQGDVRVRLVNYRYNRLQLKTLDFPLSGKIQKGVGLLIHTPLLTEKLNSDEVCRIMHGGGGWQEERIGKRLKELLQEGRSRGSTGPVGGIYLQVL